MKILGHAAAGYVVHIDQREMQVLTGAPEHYRQQYAWPVGHEVKITEAWKHVEALVGSVGELRDAGARLQALADLLREQPARLQALLLRAEPPTEAS